MSTSPVEDTMTSSHAPQKRKRSRFVTVLLIIAAFFVFFILLGVVISASLSGFMLEIESRSEALTESVLIPGKGEAPGKIVMIPLFGIIKGTGMHLQGEETVYEVSKRLRKAADDDLVNGVILQVSSPGGGLTASDILHEEIKRVRQAGKPVVVWIGNIAASGGLYVSASADWIISSPTGLTGSIGVIMQHMVVEELMQKIGIRIKPIKSTDSKDIGSIFRKMTPEEEKFFKDLIDKYHERFINIIAEGRGLETDKVRALANGKIFTAQQSLDYGLIDEIGYFDSALDKIKELCNLKSPRVVQYKTPFDLKSMLEKSMPWSGSSALRTEDAIELFKSVIDMSYAPELRAIWSINP